MLTEKIQLATDTNQAMTDPLKHIIKPYGTISGFLLLGGNQGGKKVLCVFFFIYWTSFWILLFSNFKFNKKQLIINF